MHFKKTRWNLFFQQLCQLYVGTTSTSISSLLWSQVIGMQSYEVFHNTLTARRLWFLIAICRQILHYHVNLRSEDSSTQCPRFSYCASSCKKHQHQQTRSTQRAQISTDPEDPDFGLWTPGSEAWSGSPPKLYHLVLEPCPTPPKNFVKIRSQVCE